MQKKEWCRLSGLDPTFLKGIEKLVSGVIKDMEKNKEPIPQPLSIKIYSGKFVVRISPDKHREGSSHVIHHPLQ